MVNVHGELLNTTTCTHISLSAEKDISKVVQFNVVFYSNRFAYSLHFIEVSIVSRSQLPD